MQHPTHTTNAGLGNVDVARAAFGSATFAAAAGASWHVGHSIIPSYVVMTDTKLRGRWPEEVASH